MPRASQQVCGLKSCPSDPKASYLRCSGCRRVHYCSEACQVADWKEHKKYCAVFKDKRLDYFCTDAVRSEQAWRTSQRAWVGAAPASWRIRWCTLGDGSDCAAKVHLYLACADMVMLKYFADNNSQAIRAKGAIVFNVDRPVTEPHAYFFMHAVEPTKDAGLVKMVNDYDPATSFLLLFYSLDPSGAFVRIIPRIITVIDDD